MTEALAIKVKFDKPDLAARRQIWEKMVPKEMPLASDVDFDELAKTELTGGEIKNVLLRQSFAERSINTGKFIRSKITSRVNDKGDGK